MDFFKFFEDRYFFELDRRKDLDQYIEIPIGLVSAGLAGCLFFLTKFPFIESGSGISISLIVPLAIAILALSGAILFLIKSYVFKNIRLQPNEYEVLPSSLELHNYLETVKKHAEEYEENEDYVKDEYQKAILKYYIDCGEQINRVNSIRRNDLHFSKVLLTVGLVFMIISSIPFFAKKSSFEAKNKESLAAINEMKNEIERLQNNYDSVLNLKYKDHVQNRQETDTTAAAAATTKEGKAN